MLCLSFSTRVAAKPQGKGLNVETSVLCRLGQRSLGDEGTGGALAWEKLFPGLAVHRAVFHQVPSTVFSPGTTSSSAPRSTWPDAGQRGPGGTSSCITPQKVTAMAGKGAVWPQGAGKRAAWLGTLSLL